LKVNCAISQVALDGSLSAPTGNLSYQWMTTDGHIFSGANAAKPVVDSGGWYTLTVKNLTNGCTHTANIFVEEDFVKPPVLFAQAPLLDCDHPTVQLEVFPPDSQPIYTYNWGGLGIIADGQTTKPTVDKPGVYSVTITNADNGCKNQNLLTVTENFQFPKAVANSLGVLDCDSTTVRISGAGSSAGNVSYEWTTVSGGVIQQPSALVTQVDAPGWYYLTIRRLDNGCTAIDSTEVIASSLPIDQALLSLDPPDCLDPDGFIFIDSVFGGTPPYFYSLDGDAFITYPQFSYLEPGFHEVVVEDVNGCHWSVGVYLPEPEDVLVELGDDIFIKQGQGADLSAQISIPMGQLDTVIWQGLPDSVECPQCLDQTVFPMETTVYNIKIVDLTGCWAIDKVTVWVNEERPFYVPTAFSPNADGTNDRLVLFAGQGIASVKVFRIFDRWGNLVFLAENFPPNNPAHGWDGNFDGTPMNPAVFVWMAEVAFPDGTSRVYHGETTLIR
jgi:gliding motility-associated-like protein